MEYYVFKKPGFKKRQSEKLKTPDKRSAIFWSCDANNDPKIMALHAQRDHSLLPIFLEVLSNLDLETETWEVSKLHFDLWAQRTFGNNRFNVLKRLRWLSDNGLVEFSECSANPSQDVCKGLANPSQDVCKSLPKGVRDAQNPHHSTRDYNQPNKQTKKPPTPLKGESRFEEFWNIYPRGEKKKDAKLYWENNNLDGVAEVILQALTIQMKSHDWLKEGGKFVPHPLTYLRQRRWEDDLGKQCQGQAVPNESPVDKKRKELLSLLTHAQLVNIFDGEIIDTSDLEYREPFLYRKSTNVKFHDSEWRPLLNAS